MPFAPPPPSFQREALPILRTACIGCHSAPTPAGGIALGSYAELMKGGKSGAAIVPGKSDASRLIQMIAGLAKPQMPPTTLLKAGDVDILRRWVDAGAKADAESPLAPANKATTKAPAIKIASTSLPLPHARGAFRNIAPPVQTLAFSPDGKTLAIGTYQRILLCDPATRQITAVWGGQADAVRTVAFSPDGKWLAAGGGISGAFGEARLWNVAERRESRTVRNQSDAVNAVAFSPDGKTLATGSADKSIQLWDTATGRPLQTLRDHADSVLGLDFRADGKFLASCGADRSVKIWDTATWKRLYTLGAHDEPVTAVAFAPANGPLVTVSTDHTAKIWNFAADNSGLARTLGGHEKSVQAIALSSDGQFAATASGDKTVKLWKINDGANLATFTDAKDWIYAVRFSPDGKRLAAGTWDGMIYFWNVETKKLEGSLSTLRSGK